MVRRTAVRASVPARALPAFTPVPRKSPRHDGWTPERQQAFLEALADTGCVSIAARMVNMSQRSYYQLRRQPGAESFRAAADAAQSLGLQVVKDEAFDRAMHGQLVPVFVGGKLMGFRRKKNDRLLMFILRHYGTDPAGRKTTINYFSTRATAAATSPSPSGEGTGVGESGQPAADPSAIALAASEASTTTVKTVISGPAAGTDLLTVDTEAANLINAFEGARLDEEAQAEIYRALEACAERRRALADDPDHDPECTFLRVAPGDLRYHGELESGAEGEDWVGHWPGASSEPGQEREHAWDNLGEGGNAAEIDAIVAGIKARRAAMTPEEKAAEAEASRAAIEAARAAQCLPLKPPPDPGDPRLDWRNWDETGYTGPSAETVHPEPVEGPPSDRSPPLAAHTEPEPSPDPDPGKGRAPKRPYKKRQPKPPFIPPELAPAEAGEARKAQAVAEVKADRREAAAAEARRRKGRSGNRN